MVRNCCVCGNSSSSNPNASYHRLPADDEKRRIWASLLDLSWPTICSYRNLFICSDHFDTKDLGTKSNGTRYLKQDANPIATFENSDERDSSCGSESGLYQHEIIVSSFTADQNNSYLENSSATVTASECEDEARSECENEGISECEEARTECANEARFECENEPIELRVLEQTSHNMPSKKRKGYIGSLTINDFSTPVEAMRSLHNVKTVYSRQRTKIRTLQQTIRRQKQKIDDLKNLVALMNDEYRLIEGPQKKKLSQLTLKKEALKICGKSMNAEPVTAEKDKTSTDSSLQSTKYYQTMEFLLSK